jgi:hypothetical protein
MKRRLISFLAIVSLLLCIATTSGWICSKWRRDHVMFATRDPQRVIHVLHDGGSIHVLITYQDSFYRVAPDRIKHASSPSSVSLYQHWGTFNPLFHHWGIAVLAPSPRGNHHGVLVPYALLVVLTLILPLVVGVRTWRRRQRVVEGHCPVCGYDLRATPDRCPECGHVIAAKPIVP